MLSSPLQMWLKSSWTEVKLICSSLNFWSLLEILVQWHLSTTQPCTFLNNLEVSNSGYTGPNFEWIKSSGKRRCDYERNNITPVVKPLVDNFVWFLDLGILTFTNGGSASLEAQMWFSCRCEGEEKHCRYGCQQVFQGFAWTQKLADHRAIPRIKERKVRR